MLHAKRASCSFETTKNYQTTRRHVPKHSSLHDMNNSSFWRPVLICEEQHYKQLTILWDRKWQIIYEQIKMAAKGRAKVGLIPLRGLACTRSLVLMIHIAVMVRWNLTDSSVSHRTMAAEIFLRVHCSWAASVVWWSEFLATDPGVRVRFPALPYFLSSSGPGTRPTQPRGYTRGVLCIYK
jgi:hypothetical protein